MSRKLHPAERYAREVARGEVVAGRLVKKACQRHLDDRKHGAERGLVFDEKAAQRALDFFKILCHSKGEWAGQPIELEPSQQFTTWCIFGWKRAPHPRWIIERGGKREDTSGTRRFRFAYIEIARKNGKSTWAAGIGNYLAFADEVPGGEAGAEVYCLDPSTRVLWGDLRWRPVGELSKGCPIIAFDQDPPSFGCQRKFRRAAVTSMGRVSLPCYRIRLNDGREIISSEGHLWLCRGKGTRGSTNQQWLRTDKLHVGTKLRSLGLPWSDDVSRDAGYLAGIFDGEGCFHGRGPRSGFRIAFAQRLGPEMERVRELLIRRFFDVSSIRLHKSGTGYFEIAGAYECLRFLGEIRPERLLRTADKWYEGRAPNRGCKWPSVTAIEFLGEREVVAIETTTSTLFAEGLFSHNTAATKRDQARIVHGEAVRMVKKSPVLRRHGVVAFKDNLHQIDRDQKFEPLGADSDTMDGLNVHAAILDELHAHKTRDVWDVLETSTGSRRQPLIIAITTAGTSRQGVCFEKREYTRQVLEGIVEDDSWFGIIYTLDTNHDGSLKDDWRNENVWPKSNPLLGVSKKWADMKEKAARAKSMTSALNAFLQKELNVWVQGEIKWMAMDAWRRCAGPVACLELPEYLAGRPCYSGLDLSSTLDITALVHVFTPLTEDEPWFVIPRFWIPEDNLLERCKNDNVPYDKWLAEGYLNATPGNSIDYDWIFEEIEQDAQAFQIMEIPFDRWGAARVTSLIEKIGVPMVQFGQGYRSMSPPMKDLERLVASGKLAHGGNPILTWMADNLIAKTDPAGNIKPDKEKSKEKIDGIVALLMGLDRALRNQGESGRSVYEERGMVRV
jgi:phage terminase large subunit-like protein